MSLSFSHYFSSPTQDPYAQVKWVRRSSRIQDAQGKILHDVQDLEFPDFWSQSAIDIASSKYFRKSGVPTSDGKGRETSLRQLISRVTQTVKLSGLSQGYFRSVRDAEIFESELRALLVHQRAAFNSPVWFNCGLFDQYGIQGMSTEVFAWDFESGKIQPRFFSYERPQISACFIQSVNALPESISGLIEKESKIFKFGSGSGTNFSALTSDQLFETLEILDRRAGAIKSGGVARRAAKMVCLDCDHPDILAFIDWKKKEELKLRALVAQGESGDFESKAFESLSGQNSNNSIRISDAFMKAVENDQDWELKAGAGQTRRYLSAQKIWNAICEAAWECADPGLQFSDTINRWNPCPKSGKINASNPCSEYMFLDETACNLASINLARFYHPQKGFDFQAYSQAIRVVFVAQDILVDYAGYPTPAIAENSHRFRPLGLGFANLGGLFMRMGLPYSSREAEAWTHVLTSCLQAEALRTSAEIAQVKGSFEALADNRSTYNEVMQAHFEEGLKAENSFDFSFAPPLGPMWQKAFDEGRRSGFRNSQLTVIAPTGTIGLFMDCETTGIEPEYSLIRYKNLSGGGSMKFVNAAIKDSLRNLGYTQDQVERQVEYLKATGYLEGAPELRKEHEAVFACSYSGAQEGSGLDWLSQLRIVAAAQKFISGAISKTVNLPASISATEISDLYKESHRLGLKSISIYREGSKSSQPLRIKP